MGVEKHTDRRGSVAPGTSLGTDYTTEEVVDGIGLDATEIQWRKEFIGFDEGDTARLAELNDVVTANQEALVDRFLRPVYETPETKEITDRSPRDNEALRAIVAGYYQTVTGGRYDQEYFEHRTRIGQLHNKLGMPLHYFTGMFGDATGFLVGALYDDLAERVRSHEGIDDDVAAEVADDIEDTTASARSLIKILNLDMQVVNDTFLFSYTDALKQEVETSRELRDAISDSVEGTNDSLDSVRGNVEELNDLAERYTVEATQISQEVSNLSATVEEIAASSQNASSTAERAAERTETGKEQARESVGAMEDIADAQRQLTERMDDLVAAIDQMDEIVEVINDIADQTNLLALNASIEAARAGEAGEGFAVVADEVKSLAEQTQEEAGEVETLLNDVTGNIDQASALLETVEETVGRGQRNIEQTDRTLSEIRTDIEDATNAMDEVATTTDEQASTAEEVSTMVNTFADRAERIQDETDQIADEMARQTESVDDIAAAVRRLNEDVGTDFETVARRTDWDGDRHPTDTTGVLGDADTDDDPRTAADGGGRGARTGRDPGATMAGTAPEGVPQDLYERLPEGMPDAVISSMDESTLRKVADGDLEEPF